MNGALCIRSAYAPGAFLVIHQTCSPIICLYVYTGNLNLHIRKLGQHIMLDSVAKNLFHLSKWVCFGWKHMDFFKPNSDSWGVIEISATNRTCVNVSLCYWQNTVAIGILETIASIAWHRCKSDLINSHSYFTFGYCTVIRALPPAQCTTHMEF